MEENHDVFSSPSFISKILTCVASKVLGYDRENLEAHLMGFGVLRPCCVLVFSMFLAWAEMLDCPMRFDVIDGGYVQSWSAIFA